VGLEVPHLIEAGVISKEEAAARKEGFLELLELNDEAVKGFAWIEVPHLIEAGVISKEDLTSSPHISWHQNSLDAYLA